MTIPEAIDYLTALWESGGITVNEAMALGMAIKSLEAWEKARKEIKSLKPYFCNMDNEVISKSGEGIVQECIDIIDNHLSEVSE